MKIEVEESALEAIKAMAQRLQDQNVLLLDTLGKALETLNDPRIGTCTYMEGSQIYEDFSEASDLIMDTIAKCTAEPKVME